MRALKLAMNSISIIDVDNDLKALQEAVGGRIETVGLKDGGVLIANVQGMVKQYPRNDLASYICGKPVYGAVLIVGKDGDDVDQKYVDAYMV